MRKVPFSTQHECLENQLAAGRLNPAIEIQYRDRTGRHTHIISAGSNDTLHVYREGACTYVLSINHLMEYVGLEIFEGSGKIGDIFLSDHQTAHTIGPAALEMAPYTIIRRMSEYIY